jgi:hypothetical protein
MKKKIFICIAGLLSILTASAQLKVSSDSTVCIGVYQDAASTLSVGGTGSGDYAAYVNGAGKAADDIFGTTYHPTAFPGYSTSGIQATLSQLLQLVPVAYQYNTIPPIDATGPEGTDEEGQQGRPSFTGRRFCISSQSLSTFFGELMHKDENNQWQADYDELVPALVYAVQQLYALAAQNHNIVVSPQGEITVQPADGEEPTMEIAFCLPDEVQDAVISITDLMGTPIREIPVAPSRQSVTIGSGDLPSGMYLCSLLVDGREIDSKRMILAQ